MSIQRPEPGPERRSRALRAAGCALLFLLPLALRLRPIEHGLPRNYVPDTHAVRAALGMARDRDPVPPVGKYSTYPNLLPYVLLPAYAGYFALGALDGSWSGAQEFGQHVSAHPAPVHLIARVIVALFGALTPWVVFRAARAMGMGRGAWVAAWLVAGSVLHTHYSVQERPWVPMLFFLALAMWPAARHVAEPRARTLLLSGAAAGLAFATHQSGLVALGVPALAWLCAPIGWRGSELGRRLAQGAGCVATFAVLALALGHPYLLVHGPTPSEGVVGGDRPDFSVGGQGVVLAFRLASFLRLGPALFGHDPALVVLGALGLVPALRARRTRPFALFALAWAAFFMTLASDHVRYLLPLTVLLSIPAGLAAERWIGLGRLGLAAVVLLLAQPLVLDLRFGHVLAREDTRAIAERELARALPAGALLAIDRYGPDLELDRASLERLAGWRDLATREGQRLERLRAGEITGGANAVFLSELLSYDERDHRLALSGSARRLGPQVSDAASLLQALGATHLLLVERAPGDPRGHLLDSVVRGREPLFVIDPTDGTGRCDEARLPMDMEFPFVSLWQVRRPGPRLSLYELR